MKTALQDPIKQPGFGRGNNYRAFTAAEKIAHANYFTPGRYNPATDLGPTPRAGSTDAPAALATRCITAVAR